MYSLTQTPHCRIRLSLSLSAGTGGTCPAFFCVVGCFLKRKCQVFILSTVPPSHSPASEPLLLNLVLISCSCAPRSTWLTFASRLPWAVGERLVRTRGALSSPSREKEFAPTPRCLQMAGDSPLHPCMLLCFLSRKRVIISFQDSAELQGNLHLIASDQGATRGL